MMRKSYLGNRYVLLKPIEISNCEMKEGKKIKLWLRGPWIDSDFFLHSCDSTGCISIGFTLRNPPKQTKKTPKNLPKNKSGAMKLRKFPPLSHRDKNATGGGGGTGYCDSSRRLKWRSGFSLSSSEMSGMRGQTTGKPLYPPPLPSLRRHRDTRRIPESAGLIT